MAANAAFLQFTGLDGNNVVVPIDGPGGTVRMGVGGVGHRGAVWRLWAPKNKPEVYLTNRQMSDHKVSFHPSGEWHHAVAKHEIAKTIFNSDSKWLDEWPAPEPNSVGCIKAFSIWTPAEDLIDVPGDDQTSADIIWVPAPQPGYWSGLHLVIAQPDLGDAELSDARPAAAFALSDKKIVLVMVSEHRPSDAERASVMGTRAQIAAGAAGTPGLDATQAPRATVWAYETELGGRLLYDLALYPSTTIDQSN